MLTVLFAVACGGGDGGDEGPPQPGHYRLTGDLPSGRVTWEFVEIAGITESSLWAQPGTPDFGYSDGQPVQRQPLPYGIGGTGFHILGSVTQGTLSWFLQTNGGPFSCTLLEVSGAGPYTCSFTRIGP